MADLSNVGRSEFELLSYSRMAKLPNDPPKDTFSVFSEMPLMCQLEFAILYRYLPVCRHTCLLSLSSTHTLYTYMSLSANLSIRRRVSPTDPASS